MSQNKGAICQNRLLLTDGFDFWEDLSRTSSKDRSESSEKLRFWLAFKSRSKALAKVTELSGDPPLRAQSLLPSHLMTSREARSSSSQNPEWWSWRTVCWDTISHPSSSCPSCTQRRPPSTATCV